MIAMPGKCPSKNVSFPEMFFCATIRSPGTSSTTLSTMRNGWDCGSRRRTSSTVSWSGLVMGHRRFRRTRVRHEMVFVVELDQAVEQLQPQPVEEPGLGPSRQEADDRLHHAERVLRRQEDVAES